MPTGPISTDPKNSPRQRRFDQRVADILNGLVRSGAIATTGGGWVIGSASAASPVLELRSFNFTPRYGTWG